MKVFYLACVSAVVVFASGCTNDVLQSASLTVLSQPALEVSATSTGITVPEGIAVYVRIDAVGPKGTYPGQVAIQPLSAQIADLLPDEPSAKPEGSSSCVNDKFTDRFLLLARSAGKTGFYVTPSSSCISSGDSGNFTIDVTVTPQELN
jgi:hypothetical protein